MANNTFSQCLFFVAFLFSIQSVSVFAFTTDLIHRDSPQSPFHNPKATKLERMSNIFHSSMSRAAHIINKIKKLPSDMQSQIFAPKGAYIMKLLIGTPPYPVWGVADTGSDLTWFQCQPCKKCFPEDSPIFDPRKSSTYRKMSCKSRRCSVDPPTFSCNKTNNQCMYQLQYGDGSYSIGHMGAETLTFGSVSGENISIPKVVFGCGYENDGLFEKDEDGIIGLGSSKYSIVQQLSKFTNRKFSYCLASSETNPNVTSKITFGDSVNMSGPGVVSTPLKSEMYYYITLKSIIVGNVSLPLKSSPEKPLSTNGFGGDKFNMIIDSGTTLTFIPRRIYDDLAWEVRKTNIEVKTYSSPVGSLNFCYRIKDNVQVPKIKFNFDGAEVEIPKHAAFVEVTEELMCLGIVPSDDLAIFGYLSQQNFVVEYDIDNNKLSFQPMNCTKY